MTLNITLKGGPSSGWYAPPKGTHSGEKHRNVGSGKSGGKMITSRQNFANKYGVGQVLPVNDALANESTARAYMVMDEIEIPSMMKREIVTKLSEDAGVSYEDVNDFIAQWSESSSGGDMRSLAIQKDAADAFDIPLSDDIKDSIDSVRARSSVGIPEWLRKQRQPLLPSEIQQNLLHTMYNNTQEVLKGKGFDPNGTIRLYRGAKLPNNVAGTWKVGQLVDVISNPLSSWSSDRSTAHKFSRIMGGSEVGIIFQMDVPVKAIMGSAISGFGTLTEQEFVVLGTGGTARIDFKEIAGG
jgi:hypothetical protein